MPSLVGSEMCIRDRVGRDDLGHRRPAGHVRVVLPGGSSAAPSEGPAQGHGSGGEALHVAVGIPWQGSLQACLGVSGRWQFLAGNDESEPK